MSAAVLVSPQAAEQIKRIDEWWRQHREAAPGLFLQELGEAVALLEHVPELGRRSPHPLISGLRRLVLRATRYHVYYLYDQKADTVTVLAAWSQVRGTLPKLSK